MASDQRPIFATYLLPSLTFPFRRRQSSSAPTTPSSRRPSGDSVPSLSSSPTSSTPTTPGSSPPSAHFILPSSPFSAKGLLQQALSKIPETPTPKAEKEREKHLTRTQPNTLKCLTCSSDIAFAEQIVSKGFTGRHGRAYLVAPPPKAPFSLLKKEKETALELINIRVGRSVNRELLTGAHVVADVSCAICATVLGWKYVDAKESAQKYKIGKYILEMKRVGLGVSWEDADEDELEQEEQGLSMEVGGKGKEEDGVVVFDSEDEDECEDLFAGVWGAEVVAKRRSRRIAGRRKEG